MPLLKISTLLFFLLLVVACNKTEMPAPQQSSNVGTEIQSRPADSMDAKKAATPAAPATQAAEPTRTDLEATTDMKSETDMSASIEENGSMSSATDDNVSLENGMAKDDVNKYVKEAAVEKAAEAPAQASNQTQALTQ